MSVDPRVPLPDADLLDTEDAADDSRTACLMKAAFAAATLADGRSVSAFTAPPNVRPPQLECPTFNEFLEEEEGVE